MAKDLTLNVVAKKDSRQLEELAAEFDALNKKVDDNSKSLQRNASFSKLLDDRIAATKKQVHELGVEANKTGNVDVFRNLRNAEKNLAGLERLKKQLSTALDIKVTASTSSSGGFFGNLGKSLKNLVTGAGLSGVKAGDVFGKGLVGAAGEALAAGAPALAPAVVLLVDEAFAIAGGAISAGVGAGGLAVGIVGAFQNPEVKAAGQELGTTLKGTLTEVGQSFVGPVRQALLDLDQAAFRGSDQVAKAFEPLARAIAPIEKGIEGFVDSALPGLTKAFANAEPVIEEVGRQLPGLGRAIGDALEKITHNVDANKGTIQLVFQLIEKTIEGLGTLIRTAENVFAGFVHVVEPVGAVLDDTLGKFDRLVGKIPIAGEPFKFLGIQIGKARDETGDLDQKMNGLHGTVNAANTAIGIATSLAGVHTSTLGDMGSAAQHTADAEARLTAQFDEQVNKLLALEGTQDAYQKGLNDLSKALSQHTLTLRGNTDDAIQNRQAIRDLIANAEQARQAAIDHAGGVNASSAAIQAANVQYEENLKKLEALGVQLGLRKEDLDAIVGEYDINIVVKTSGTAPTHINPDGTISVGKIKAFASGGRYQAGQPRIVGENGPELDIPDHSGVIIPPRPGYAPVAAAVGAGTTSVTLNVGTGAESQVGTLIKYMIQHGILTLSVSSDGRTVT